MPANSIASLWNHEFVIFITVIYSKMHMKANVIKSKSIVAQIRANIPNKSTTRNHSGITAISALYKLHLLIKLPRNK